tara:strand:+ start:20467 stop:20826 length:360 start_codon:yes stop_codon:yes gene_type:complete
MRKIKLAYVFIMLLTVKILILRRSFKESIQNLDLNSAIPLFITKSELIEIVEKFYKKKIFSCFTCSILIKKLNPKNTVLFIGAKSNDSFSSHAWIEDQNKKIIFGGSNNIKEYRVMLTK